MLVHICKGNSDEDLFRSFFLLNKLRFISLTKLLFFLWKRRQLSNFVFLKSDFAPNLHQSAGSLCGRFTE